jgi:2-keto-4-pentenoate hydratase/2-oxohepta-3-ene-1,7-dioic acid hydratase in catechol pathway
MKIICVGRNYVAHALELNNPVPDEPLLFMKPPTAMLREGRPFYIPEFTNEVHYELELVVKICKNGKYIDKAYASSYYNELTLGIDFTARDLQSKLKSKGHPWEIAKGFDFSAAIGRWLPFTEEMKKEPLQFSMLKNGEKVQDGSTELMIFSIDDLIVHMSRYFKLQFGDLIFTGTPAGVGKVEIGDHFEGLLGEEKLLDCQIK